ncbi:Cullin [Tribonema minus]|uniref:Cullin n=1 Tax=Tribonema minus TaxID=303371 RepID=A0A835YSZ1_9STRA|nr:Cullin [Tribonema minus]
MSLLSPEPIDFDETWGLLESSLLTILMDFPNKNFPNDLWMTLYTGVYKLCTKPMDAQPGKLYFKLKEVLEDYVDGVLQGLLAYEACTAHCSLDLLARYRGAFDNYATGMGYAADIFSYLDRHWVATNHCETGRSPQDGVYTVYEMALVVWKELAFESLKVKLRNHIMAVLNAARERDAPSLDDGGAVRGVLATYEALGMERRDRSALFQRELEDHLVADAKRYFARRGTALLAAAPVAAYLRAVEGFLAAEGGRCACAFGPLTARRILISAQVALIGQHSERLVEEAKRMLSAVPEQRDDLRRLYTLISYLDDDAETPGAGVLAGGGPLVLIDNPSMAALQHVVQEHIRAQGLLAVRDAQATVAAAAAAAGGGGDGDNGDDASAMGGGGAAAEGKPTAATSDEVVAAMLRVYQHYRGLVGESFMNAAAFRGVLDEACKAFVNAMPSAPEWLARHAHCLLDRSFRESRIEEDARREALDRVGFLFAYIADKDVFHKYYAKLLSKRIIQLTSVSNDAEERMLDNMRRISGFEFTSKLQRMFVDKTLSRDLHTGYMEWLEVCMGGAWDGGGGEACGGGGGGGGGHGGVAAAVAHVLLAEGPGGASVLSSGSGFEAFTFVLTAGCWPLQSVNSTFQPPAPIHTYVQRFLEFYNEVHSRRKLEWLYHLGHGEMSARCFDKPYRVYSSTFQMGVLYQFNARDAIGVSDIAKGIAISETELSRHLYPLIKAGLLVVRDAAGQDVRGAQMQSCDDIIPQHVIAINTAFTSKRSRIKINIVDHSRQPVKGDVPPVELISDRKASVQAAVCRIMKARRELAHRDLCTEVKAQLVHLFVPDVPFIKKCIEELIDKDYLGRVEGKDMYTYCA